MVSARTTERCPDCALKNARRAPRIVTAFAIADELLYGSSLPSIPIRRLDIQVPDHVIAAIEDGATL
jgi:hypothetical protein